MQERSGQIVFHQFVIKVLVEGKRGCQLIHSSCWAVSSASVLSDRMCISTNGANKGIFAASQDPLTCAEAPPGNRKMGCNGGSPVSLSHAI
jgi:hypothetical protein